MATECDGIIGLRVRVTFDTVDRTSTGTIVDVLPRDQDPPMDKVFKYYGERSPVGALQPSKLHRLIIDKGQGYLVMPLRPEFTDELLEGTETVRIYGGWIEVLGR